MARKATELTDNRDGLNRRALKVKLYINQYFNTNYEKKRFANDYASGVAPVPLDGQSLRRVSFEGVAALPSDEADAGRRGAVRLRESGRYIAKGGGHAARGGGVPSGRADRMAVRRSDTTTLRPTAGGRSKWRTL